MTEFYPESCKLFPVNFLSRFPQRFSRKFVEFIHGAATISLQRRRAFERRENEGKEQLMGCDLTLVDGLDGKAFSRYVPWRTMAGLVAEMDRQGMLKHIEAPACPHDGRNGLTPEEEHMECIETCMAMDTGSGGIPAFKLEANEWLVTPSEIDGALAVAQTPPIASTSEAPCPMMDKVERECGMTTAVEPMTGEEWVRYWTGFLWFLAVAMRSGGFRVW